MKNKTFFLVFGVLIVGLFVFAAKAAPRENSTISHDETVFNAGVDVARVVAIFPAKLVGYQMNNAEAATNTLSVIATRVESVIDRTGPGAPVVTTWTNSYTITAISTTNTSESLDSGAVDSTFYTRSGDSIQYTNTISSNAILSLQWQY